MSNLTTNYLNNNSVKTAEILKEANEKGQILLIDEIYDTMNNKDSFAEECMETIQTFINNNPN